VRTKGKGREWQWCKNEDLSPDKEKGKTQGKIEHSQLAREIKAIFWNMSTWWFRSCRRPV